MEPISIVQHVRRALSSSQSTSTSTQRQSQAFLFEFQKTTEAWSFAIEILLSDQLDGDDAIVQFFAAQTLQVKISRDWDSLPSTEYKEQLGLKLKEMLFMRRPAGNSAVTRKLATVLAAYAFKTIPTSWPTAIHDIIHWCNDNNTVGKDQLWIMSCSIEVLTVLPEELTRSQLSVEQRAPLNASLGDSFGEVMQLLDFALGDQVPSDLRVKASRCLQSWIQFEVPVHSLPPLINRVMGLMRDPETFEAAADVIYELVHHPQSHQFERSLCQGLLPQLSTGEMFEKYCQAYEELDDSIVSVFCRLMVGFGEQFPSYVIEKLQLPEVSNLLQIIYQCTDYPGTFVIDEDISDSTLNFWYILQDTAQDIVSDEIVVSSTVEDAQIIGQHKIELSEESLNEIADSERPHQDQNSESHKQNAENLQRMETIYLQLIKVLWRKAIIPPDFSNWNSDDKGRFKTYRRDLADTMVHCHYFLDDRCLLSLAELVQSQITSDNPHHLEAAFFLLRSVAESISSTESTYLTGLVSFALSIESQMRSCSDKLLQTTLLMIGSYASWLSSQPSPFVEQAFTFILKYLTASQNPDVIAAAFRAFSNICDACRTHLVGAIQALAQMFTSADAAQLKPEHRSTFVEGISYIVQALPIDQQLPIIEAILSHSVSSIDAMLLQITSTAVQTAKIVDYIGHELQNINSVFRGIQVDEEDAGLFIDVPLQPKQVFFSNYSKYMVIVWPCIEKVCSSKSPIADDDRVIQPVFSFLEISTLVFKSGRNEIAFLTLNSALRSNIFVLPEFSFVYCESFSRLIVGMLERGGARPTLLEGSSSLVSVFGPYAELMVGFQTAEALRSKHPNFTLDHFTLCKRLEISLKQLVHGSIAVSLHAFKVTTAGNNVQPGSLYISLALQMDQMPDLADSFLTLLDNCVRRFASSLFIDSSLFSNLASEILLAALLVKERNSFRSGLQLFHRILAGISEHSGDSKSQIASNMRQLILLIAPLFCHLVIDGIAYEMPRTSLHSLSEILHTFIVCFPNESRVYVRLALGLPVRDDQIALVSYWTPVLSSWGARVNANQSQKEQFAKILLSTRQLKRFRDSIKDFAATCRGTFAL